MSSTTIGFFFIIPDIHFLLWAVLKYNHKAVGCCHNISATIIHIDSMAAISLKEGAIITSLLEEEEMTIYFSCKIMH